MIHLKLSALGAAAIAAQLIAASPASAGTFIRAASTAPGSVRPWSRFTTTATATSTAHYRY